MKTNRTSTTSEREDAHQRKARDADRDQLRKLLGSRLWFWRSLAHVDAWEWLIPWPLGRVVFWRKHVDDNAWATAAALLWASAMCLVDWNLASFEAKYAADVSKALLAGAFLLGTVLSVSVALPGQSLAKLTLGRTPSWAFNFVMPLVWGFSWGVLGAVLMLFFPGLAWFSVSHPSLTTTLRAVAIYVAIFGAFMEVNAIVHTVRMYLAGMVIWSEDIDDEDQQKAEAAALSPATSPARVFRGAAEEDEQKGSLENANMTRRGRD